MGKARVPETVILCPVCLLSSDRCKLREKAESLKFADNPADGLTRSQALALWHKDLCPVCRYKKSKCEERRQEGKTCRSPQMFSWEHFPSWWREEDAKKYL